jgi:hypothetical protein
MTADTRTGAKLMTTECGRTITVSRFAPAEPPTRITSNTLSLHVPESPPGQARGPLTAVGHCAVGETLAHHPRVTIVLRGSEQCASPTA